MSKLDSVGRDTGGSFGEVAAKPRSSCWGQQRTVTQGGEVDTGKGDSAPESIRCLSGLSAPQNGALPPSLFIHPSVPWPDSAWLPPHIALCMVSPLCWLLEPSGPRHSSQGNGPLSQKAWTDTRKGLEGWRLWTGSLGPNLVQPLPFGGAWGVTVVGG